MDMNLTFHHDGTAGTYDLYFYSFFSVVYACVMHGTERLPLIRDTTGTALTGTYVRLTEGDTCELHMVDGSGSNDYFQSVYTAASGEVTAVEHNITTTIVSA